MCSIRHTTAITTDKDTQNAVQIQVYNNFEQLEAFQQEWDSFVESVSGDIFLTFDWCRIWWKYYGTKRKLKIFIFRNRADTIVGIIPLFFENIWLGPIFVRTVRIVASDSTGDQICVPIHAEYIRRVLHKLFELLLESKWDILHLGPIAGLYKDYEDLKDACEELFAHRYLVVSERKGVQTYFQLADNWEKQLAKLKKGERWDIKRSYKTLFPEGNCLVSTVASKDNFEQTFEDFVNMHQSYWQNLGKLGHFGDWPAAQNFHHEVATAQLRHDRLRLLEIKSGARCLGYEYAYKFGEQYFEFLNARSCSKELAKISVGRLVFSEMVKKALNEGIRYIDSMQGKYEHKLRLGGELFPVRSLYIIQNRLSSKIRVSIFRVLAQYLNLCYYRIWFNRIAPKLPFKRKPLWKIWIRSNVFS